MISPKRGIFVEIKHITRACDYDKIMILNVAEVYRSWAHTYTFARRSNDVSALKRQFSVCRFAHSQKKKHFLMVAVM